MKIFKNFFVCNKEDPTLSIAQIKIRELDQKCSQLNNEVSRIKNDVNVLFRDNTDIKTDIKNLDLKLDNRFDILTGKLDNLILLLKNN